MNLFQKFAAWAEQQEECKEAETKEELVSILKQLTFKIDDNPDIFEQIDKQEIDTPASVTDFAQIIALLCHPDLAFQKQGLALLLGFDSREVWDSLMLGVSISHDVQHSALEMTTGLNRALLQNPYYDYSDVKRQVLSLPFADDLMDIIQLKELEELHLQFWGKLENRDDIFRSLRGLHQLPKLKKLVVLINTRIPFPDFPNQDWTNYMQNIEHLELYRTNGEVSTVDYSFVDSLPNLKKLTITGLEISYQNAKFKNQPELVINSSTSTHNRVAGIVYLLPEEKSALRIKKLILNHLSPYYPTGLLFLANMQVDKLILSNVEGLCGLQVLKDLPYDLELYAHNVSKHRMTWSDEVLQEHGAESLEDLLNDKSKWIPVLTSLKDIPE